MGKGGGALSTWIKEFCTLVFIQTIQAFTYAIIIVVIVRLQFANVIETSTRTAAMGLFTIIALVSVFKIEDLLRKIFGISPTKADHRGAIKSIAKFAFAGHLGKRVLNNVGKVTGGIGARIKSRKDLKKLNQDMAEDKEALMKDINLRRAAAGGSSGGGATGGSGTGSGSSGGTGSGVGSNSTNVNMNGYNQKIRAMEKEYEQKRKEILNARKEGMKQIAKGFTETGGAIIGGTMGGIIGIADGDIDDGIAGLMGGAGLGDAIGEGAVDTVVSMNKHMSDAISATKGSIKRIKGNATKRRNGQPTVPMSTFTREQAKYNKNMAELENLREQLNRLNNVDDIDD